MIKTILLTLFIGWSLCSLYAQSYHPLPISNASWSDVRIKQGECDGPNYCKDAYFFAGDTLIQSMSYHRLYRSNGTNIFYAGALREENKKVYYRNYNCSNTIVLYDFGLQVGDTFNLPTFLCDYSAGWSTAVTKIDSVMLENMTYRKRFHFDWGYQWIEGVGSPAGLLYPYYLGWACMCNVYSVCVRHNGEILYLDETFLPCFNFMVSEDELFVTTPHLNVFPNPAFSSSEVHIESSDENLKRIDIYNTQGYLIQSISEIESNRLTLPTKNLDSGLYLLRIYFENQVIHKKIILNH